MKFIDVKSTNKGMFAMFKVNGKIRAYQVNSVLYPFGRDKSAYIVNAIGIDYRLGVKDCVMEIEDTGEEVKFQKNFE